MTRYQTGLRAVTDRYPTKKPTKYQKTIIRFSLDGKGHGLVNACPGSGKTSTIEYVTIALNAVENVSILALAFGKDIAVAMSERIKAPNVKAQTLNSLGHGLLTRSRWNGAEIDENKTWNIATKLVGYDNMEKKQQEYVWTLLGPIKRLIALCKGFGFGAIREMPELEDILELADKFDIELPDIDGQEFVNLLLDVFDACNEETKVIDWNDQLYLPVKYNMIFPTHYGYVLVDESQDLNTIQIEMVRRLIGKYTRVIMVGDVFQSIYGFRGADPRAIQTIQETFDPIEMPLSISWRCSKAVVREAARINPTIEAAPGAREGVVETVNEDMFMDSATDGDMVLCRTSAPLVKHCLDMIRIGKKAWVAGKDIGKGLATALKKIVACGYEGSIIGQIQEYRTAQLADIDDEGKAAKIRDKMETLIALADGCRTLADVERRIASIFADDKRGIMFSTVHKAKGLEAERVWILHPELMPHPLGRSKDARIQERNIKFVAITRAMNELRYVRAEQPVRF